MSRDSRSVNDQGLGWQLTGRPRITAFSSWVAVEVVLSLGIGASISQATVDVVVDISSQTMTVEAEDGAASYTWKVSTAKKGYRTPLGSFKPQWLARMHYSTLYDASPMPYSIFFKGNFAIHGTDYVKRLGRPASHGCIRLAPENARVLFNLVKEVGKENVTIRIIP